MSSAQRLAMQRLARSQDRQEQRQVSSQTTSSSSYGAWFTPGVDKPIRRLLTSPSKQIAAQQEQVASIAQKKQGQGKGAWRGSRQERNVRRAPHIHASELWILCADPTAQSYRP